MIQDDLLPPALWKVWPSCLALHNNTVYPFAAACPPILPPLLQSVLHLPITPAADMWALGCTLFEAATGSQLFAIQPGEDFTAEEHHLWMIRQLTSHPSLQVGWYVAEELCST